MHRRRILSLGISLPAAAFSAPAPPNVLLIMADQHRGSALGCAGNKIVKTPNLDRLASQGILYRNAVTPCPVCVPARTSILTGRSMQGNRVTGNDAAADIELDPGPSFDNLLAGRGYRTEYYGKYHAPYRMARTYDNKVPYTGKRVAGAPSHRQQYLDYLDKHVPPRPLRAGELLSKDFNRPYTPAPLDARFQNPNAETSQGETYGVLHIPKEHTLAAYTVGEALHALDRLKRGPFSLTCSIGPPHPPFFNVAPYSTMYPPGEIPLPENLHHDMSDSPYRERAARMPKYAIADQIRSGISIYYGMVTEVDDQVGRLLRRLDELGLTANTLVIYTSDHGEMMGAHGMGSKMTFYEESVNVPLLMRFPGRIKAGAVVHDPVSTMDLFATILDYLDVPAPPREGYSLRRPSPDFRVSEWHGNNVPNFMVRTRDWKLITAKDSASKSHDALFHLARDPFEKTNLLESHPKQAEELRAHLLQWRQRAATSPAP